MKLRSKIALVCCTMLVCALFALAGCSNSSGYTPPSSDPAVSSPTIAQDGLLRVGVNTGNAPLAGMGSDKIIGIDVDVAAAIADNMGLKLSIVDVGNNPNGALSNDTVDIVLGIDKSDAGDAFWLSENYLPTGVAAFAATQSAPVPTPNSGDTFAAQTSSKSAWAVQNEFGAASLASANNLTDAFSDLDSGKVDYVAADAVIGYYAAHSQNDKAYLIAMLLQPSGYCAGVSHANTALQTAVASAIQTLTTNGVIDVIEMKWLGATMDLSTVPMIAQATNNTQTAPAATAANTEGGLTTGTNAIDPNASSTSSSSDSDDSSGDEDSES